jgi:ketosteroid isomerase-like protein
MSYKLLLTSSILALTACQQPFGVQDEAAIRTVMADQEKAWDRGDIPAFMQGYADSICFISRTGRTCGKQAVTEHYLKTYPDKATMGDLDFGGLEVLGAGPDHAWCTGTWELRRAQDTIGGGFSLFWARGAEGWRIVRDHTY